MAAAGGRGQPGRDALMRMARAGVGRPAAGAVGCGGAVAVPSLAAGRAGSPYAWSRGWSEGRLPPKGRADG